MARIWIDAQGQLQAHFTREEVEERYATQVLGCPEWADLCGYVGDEDWVDQVAERRIQAHLSQCQRCRDLVEELRADVDYLNSEEGKRTQEALLARINEGRTERARQSEETLRQLRVGDRVYVLKHADANDFLVEDETVRPFGEQVEVEKSKVSGKVTMTSSSGVEVSMDPQAFHMPSEPIRLKLAAASGNEDSFPSSRDLRTLYTSPMVDVLYNSEGAVFLRLKGDR